MTEESKETQQDLDEAKLKYEKYLAISQRMDQKNDNKFKDKMSG